MDYGPTLIIVYHSIISIHSWFYMLLNFLFLRKYVSTLKNWIVRMFIWSDGHLSTILFICLELFIDLVKFKRRV